MSPEALSETPEGRQRMARALRRWIIEQSLASNVGHIGSALSVTEIMAALFGGALRDPGTRLAQRDRFILGKGHAALALYGALRWRGLLDEATFRTYCGDGSLLSVHPDHSLAGVDVSTGSLGQGLSIGCGLALAFVRQQNPARVCVLMSDAEVNEGQVWEAAMLAGHHRLQALRVVLDWNGLQALGQTRQVIDLDRPAALWESVGWDSREVDGHDIEAVHAAVTTVGAPRPRVVIARTVLGKGVSFMENQLDWHYRNLTPELAERALAELAAQA